MALNDDVMDDIDNTVVDDNIIKGPNVVTPSKQEPIQIVAANGVTGDPANLTEASLAKLPSMDVKFKLIEDQTTTVVSLQEVEANILSNESICKADVSELINIYPDMLLGIISVEHYTNTRTQTCYKDTLKFIGKQRALEEATLVTSIRDFIDAPLTDAKALMQRIEEHYLLILKDQCATLYTLTTSVNPNLVMSTDGSITDIHKVGIETIDYSKIKIDSIDGPLLNKAASNINKALGSYFTNTFIHGCVAGRDLEYIKTKEASIEYNGKSLTVMDLVLFYHNAILNDNLTSLYNSVTECLSQISKLQDTAGSNLENGTVASTYIAENSEMILDMIKQINLLSTLIFNLNVINANAITLLTFYKTL